MDGDMGDCQKDELDEFANDEEILNQEKKESQNSRPCLGQSRCMLFKGIWKVECIHILWLDQPSEIQEETLGRW